MERLLSVWGGDSQTLEKTQVVNYYYIIVVDVEENTTNTH